ncbi:MAG: peptidase prolyl oligopeptidase active site domain protein, partial [Marmoricola sp.]|nr:peptidase prolyl oligopeptidase active site domain protein [Marmoricola sp.]
MTDPAAGPPATPFHDLDDYLALGRGSGLLLSPAGDRLVTAVQSLNPDGNGFVTALWEVDPAGERPARRLTRSAAGESGAAYLPDGSLLFTSTRPDPGAGKDETGGDERTARVWLLPAGGGEARVVASRPGGVDAVGVARRSGHVVVVARTFPSATDDGREEAVREDRRTRKVAAILHEGAPVRFWDHDLGPDRPRLFVGEPFPDEPAGAAEPSLDLRDLTPRPARALDGLEAGGFDVAPDGSRVVTTWAVPERGGVRQTLVEIDVATGERRTLLEDPEAEFGSPRFSPDGTRVALVREIRSTPYEPGDLQLAVLDLADRSLRVLGEGWDRWPHDAQWTPDGTALVTTADEDGRAPVFRIDVAGGAVTRLTGDAFAYSDVQVSPDGRTVFATRTSYAEPARPVRLDATTPDQDSVPLRGPLEPPAL